MTPPMMSVAPTPPFLNSGQRHFLTPEMMAALPESARLYRRVLKSVQWEDAESELVLHAPSDYHQSLLLRLEDCLALAWGRKLCIVFDQVSRQHAPEPSAHQVPLSLPPKNSTELAPLKDELISVPIYISSPALEVPLALLRQWASGAAGVGVLWVQGPSGSGKSQLLRQVSLCVSAKKRVRFVTIAGFLQEWRVAIETRQTPPFVRKYRKETDVLVVENLDEIQNKPGTQQELFYAIEAILEAGGLIAVASRGSPNSFENWMDVSLLGKLRSGIFASMAAPDRAFKQALLEMLLKRNNLELEEWDVAVLERLLGIRVPTTGMACSLFANALCRLSIKKQLDRSDLDELEQVYAVLPAEPSRCSYTPEALIDRVCACAAVSVGAVKGGGRQRNIVLARKFVYLALSQRLGLTNALVGQLLGKDASTVSHGLKSVQEAIEKDESVHQQWRLLSSRL